jgi:quercetin dioxygenase-like cupin family protein
MRIRWILAASCAAAALGAGTAIATHVPQIDPNTVPVGFLATHNDVANFKMSSFARAVRHHRADVMVQHAQLGPNAATPWHTHPGPAIVTIVSGSLSYQDQHGRRCHTVTYQQGHGFVDRGFGHVHRAIAGPSGAHFYVTYVVPSGSATHIILADPPSACS